MVSVRARPGGAVVACPENQVMADRMSAVAVARLYAFIRSSFWERLSFLMAISRLRAVLLSRACSRYTMVTGSRERVYFAPFPLL